MKPIYRVHVEVAEESWDAFYTTWVDAWKASGQGKFEITIELLYGSFDEFEESGNVDNQREGTGDPEVAGAGADSSRVEQE